MGVLIKPQTDQIDGILRLLDILALLQKKVE